MIVFNYSLCLFNSVIIMIILRFHRLAATLPQCKGGDAECLRMVMTEIIQKNAAGEQKFIRISILLSGSITKAPIKCANSDERPNWSHSEGDNNHPADGCADLFSLN